MQVKEALDGLRGTFAECRATAFADLSASMILATSTREKIAQEALDALCATAVDVLGGDLDGAAAQALENEREQVSQAVVFSGDGAQVFLRSGNEATEALCCLCDTTIDLEAFLAEARSTFAKVDAST